MNKEQFLHDLTVQLNLSVSDQVIREQIAYYDSYICGEVRKGRSEAEVIEELGSPRLLAKTIIDTAEAAGDPIASQDDEIRGTVDLEPDSDAFDHFRANYSGTGARSCETEAEDAETVRRVADMADIFVSDAFGTVHRAHASTAGVAAYLPAVAGFLIGKELSMMGGALENPERPFVAILGGAKVADKIGVITNLLNKCDTLLIGGGMAYTFFKAMGYEIGDSLLDAESIDLAKQLMETAKEKGVKLLLPVDTVVAKAFAADAEHMTVAANAIPAGWQGLDIGEKTRELFAAEIKNAKTVIWNGPMGVFEFPEFAKGTEAVAKACAECGGTTIIGGGDSASAVKKLGYADKMTHISTGGGASLEFLEGKVLPGVAALNDK